MPQAGSELAAKAVVVPRVLLGARLEAGTAGMWDKAEAGAGPEAAPGSFGTFLVGSEELSTCTRLGLPQFPTPRKEQPSPHCWLPKASAPTLCQSPESEQVFVFIVVSFRESEAFSWVGQ